MICPTRRTDLNRRARSGHRCNNCRHTFAFDHDHQVCGAGWGERCDSRVNQRNGYRAREWDTRAGTVELAIPKLRQGSFFPDSENDRRERAGRV